MDEELWERTQIALKERAKLSTNNKFDAPLKNPLAGLFWCKKCGRSIKQHPYKHARDRFECSNRRICQTKSVAQDEVIDAIALILETEKLPELEVKLKNDDGKSAVIQRKQLEKLNKQLAELKEQEHKQYDFLERGIYSEEKFLERNKKLVAEMEELKTRIFNAKKEMPKEIDYAEKIVKLQDAIKCLRSDDMTAEVKNKILKAIIDRIEYELVGYEGFKQTKYKLHIFLLM